MKVTVRLFAHFLTYLPNNEGNRESVVTLPDGSTVAQLIKKLGLPPEIPKVILINGVYKDLEDKLSNKDIISIFPPVGGG